MTNIVAPNRFDALIDASGAPTSRLADVLESLVTNVNALTGEVSPIVENTEPYTATGISEDRDLDVSAVDISITDPPTQEEVEAIRDGVLQMADVVGTLIADLQGLGIVP